MVAHRGVPGLYGDVLILKAVLDGASTETAEQMHAQVLRLVDEQGERLSLQAIDDEVARVLADRGTE